jgi:hypothetical protein
MRFESLRLDEVLRREIAIAWHEGVSVMQAICRELPDASNPGARFPLAAEVAISPEGAVSLLRRPSGSPGVTIAGQLLGDMLQSDVPVKLRLIHSEAVATTPSFATIKDLSDALAYFERPDAQQVIQELYVKAAAKPARHEELNLVDLEDFLPESPSNAAAGDAHRPDAPLAVVKPEPVQPQLAQAHDAARPEAPVPAPRQPNRRPQTGLIAVAVIVAFAVVASGAFLTYGREQPEAPTDVEAPDSPTPAAAPVGGAAAKNSKGTAAHTPTTKTRTDAKAASQSGPARTSTPSSGSAGVRPGADSHVPSDAVSTTLTSQSTVPDPSWAASLPLITRESIERHLPAPGANGEFVYSRANREVAPPVAIRPHLPSEPPADYVSEHLMVLDLVVTSKGDVESVRLLTAPKTINDFMIVSAAKAWLFAPAKLNGRPVKYKHRIRFIVP